MVDEQAPICFICVTTQIPRIDTDTLRTARRLGSYVATYEGQSDAADPAFRCLAGQVQPKRQIDNAPVYILG